MKYADDTPDLFSAKPGTPAAMSVSEFTRILKTLIENSFPIVTVRGEISNLRRQASGHIYFTLKDASSQVPAVLFRNDALLARIAPRDGQQVVVTGSVNLYEPRGTYQIVVRFIEADGTGHLQQEFVRLKEKLAAEGLFDRDRKRPLPPLPRVIGIVTSPTGAALQDFLRILRRRAWGGRVIVLPVRVQGAEAATEITAAIALANSLGLLDLLVIARGGGSIEDLWPFNEERVVRAIHASHIPVISAIGHETDFTLSDFVADIRAETPSGAAELVSSAYLACVKSLERAQDALQQTPRRVVETLTRRLALALAELARHAPQRRIENAWLRLDDLRNRLQSTPLLAVNLLLQRLASARSHLDTAAPDARLREHTRTLASQKDRLHAAFVRHLERASDKLRSLEHHLRSTSIAATLQRGFAIVLDADGSVLCSAKEITPNRALRLRFADGEVNATSGDIRPPER
ncbi:MAG: exodeoxyribonuclease VII large subunit [Puniceicoccales bacterium]|jgi:exodeoxyribonuclease VII large subunit|nr:exodeoxyribonuclease VII large subunit [Puniceicoccales bacterium]